MFVLALAGSAFTRFSTTSTAKAQAKNSITAYYEGPWNTCESWVVTDDNCVPEQLGYICWELTEDNGWQVMLQYAFGTTCYQPYYSYWDNCTGCD